MILDFFENSIDLKKIPRQGWMDKLSMKHPESVSDHSYSVAIICMVISDMQNLNSEKILKMALLHDLAESQIGDFTPDQIDKEEKKKIIETIPKLKQFQIDELMKIFKEEAEKFAELPVRHKKELEKMVDKHRKEWEQLEDECQVQGQQVDEQSQVDDIKKQLGL